MSALSYFWPPSGERARSVAVATVLGGVVYPRWADNKTWFFNDAAVVAGGFNASGHYPGFMAIVSDNANGYWAVNGTTLLAHVTAANTSTTYALASGTNPVGVGVDFAGFGYYLTSSGTLYDQFSAWCAQLPGSTNYYMLPYGSGGTQFVALLQGANELGFFTVASGGLTFNTSGVTFNSLPLGLDSYATGVVSLPAALSPASCMATGANGIAIGGWALASGLPAAAALAIDPVNPALLLAASGGTVTTYTAANASAATWTFSASASGFSPGISALSWVPFGTQALLIDPTANVLQVMSFTAGALALTQTIGAGGLTSVAVLGNGVQALAAQPVSGRVEIFGVVGGTWSASGFLAGLPSCSAVISTGLNTAVAGVASGYALLQYSNLVWSVGSTGALSFTPRYLATDPAGNIYAAASGHAAKIGASGIVASGAWSGACSGLVADQNRIVVTDPANNLLRVFTQNTATTLTQSASAVLASGLALTSTASTLFAAASGSTRLYKFSGPFGLAQTTVGAVSYWNGSTFTTAVMNSDNHPSALSVDASGDMAVATRENNFFLVASGGAVTSGFVASYQAQTVPLGISSVYPVGSGYIFGTSMPGVIISSGVSTQPVNPILFSGVPITFGGAPVFFGVAL